jgi:hypothetical protein
LTTVVKAVVKAVVIIHNMEGCMVNENKETLMCDIINQVPDLYLAELVQLADFIRGLKTARKFMSTT